MKKHRKLKFFINKRISAFLLQIDNKYYTNVSKNVQIS